jgi:ParB-like chromosome segregation protein Spo0J
MVKTKVYTREEYVTLIPPISSADYERLKRSIKEEGGLLMPIIINQDNVVLDGHHRLRACYELGFPVTYYTKNFTGKPLEELRYVVTVNLHRRHLDEFQRAEIGLKWDKIARSIAGERRKATQFTSETGREAIKNRFHGPNIASEIRSASGDAHRIEGDDGEADYEALRSSQEIGDDVGVSASRVARNR